MINKCEIFTEPSVYTDFIKPNITDEDLQSKLKQIKEITNCNEEQGILLLHDCNYNVEYAINKMLSLNTEHDIEWKTKKGKQKKNNIKNKEIEKDDLNNNVKSSTNIRFIKDKIVLDVNEISYMKQLNQDSYNSGKTFRNYNLHRTQFSGYSGNEDLLQELKAPLMDLTCKWNGKSIIIENPNFESMPTSDLLAIMEVKATSNEKSIIIPNVGITKGEIKTESSIMFKTHCSTKPPPKVQYSLAAPVQIINKNITQRSMPKLKFGDTDFCDSSQNSSFENSFKLSSANNISDLQPSVINVEDNSIIKMGPSQKIFVDQSTSNFSATQNMYNQNSYFAQKNFNQSSITNHATIPDFQKCNSVDQYYDNFSYINPLSCNTGFQSFGSYTPSNINNIKDIVNHSKTAELYLNQSQSSTYPSQSNINHPKSTIYIVPNVMMNPINTLYMTVANPMPTSALSPPMAPIQAQYNLPQLSQHSQIYFDEFPNPTDDIPNQMKKQYNQTRQPMLQNRTKKSYGDVPEEGDIVRGNYKGLSTFPPNQLSKQTPINYPVYTSLINTASTRSPLITNQLNNISGNFPPQQQHEFDNVRKRSLPIQNSNFSGKSWS